MCRFPYSLPVSSEAAGVVFIGASNECWFIWSISSIWFVWLIGLEIHPEEPDRPERPANQTDEPERVARARCASTLREHVARAQEIISLHLFLYSKHLPKGVVEVALDCAHRTSTF
jgi:hypothetical protein